MVISTPTDKEPKTSSPAAKPAGGQAGLRHLLKSYVRLMNGYGLSDTIPSTSVVNRHWTEKDIAATVRAFENAGYPAADVKKPSEALLASILEAHDFGFNAKPNHSPQAEQLGTAYSFMLSEISKASQPAVERLPKPMQKHLEQLHPLMRAPVANALHELSEKHQIRLRLTEGYRSPEAQNDLVRRQVSYAPSGYSLHGHGLALDVVPIDARGNPIWNTKHPHWKTVIETMRSHGLYSLGAEKNWDYPHFELPLNSKEVLRYPELDNGWRMIPPEKIPQGMRNHYSPMVAAYEQMQLLSHRVSELYTTPMAVDKTYVARPPAAKIIER
jgi:hypothetical protein